MWGLVAAVDVRASEEGLDGVVQGDSKIKRRCSRTGAALAAKPRNGHRAAVSDGDLGMRRSERFDGRRMGDELPWFREGWFHLQLVGEKGEERSGTDLSWNDGARTVFHVLPCHPQESSAPDLPPLHPHGLIIWVYLAAWQWLLTGMFTIGGEGSNIVFGCHCCGESRPPMAWLLSCERTTAVPHPLPPPCRRVTTTSNSVSGSKDWSGL